MPANRPFYHIIAVNTDDRCVSEGVESNCVLIPCQMNLMKDFALNVVHLNIMLLKELKLDHLLQCVLRYCWCLLSSTPTFPSNIGMEKSTAAVRGRTKQ
ncbi:hypothetical protein TNIN_412641 [Trichonephila inaurata madagascariensis]|uniref:Uncharacterized protein n=1 Tax=Trichonephila inaurata madagascariensis TaxID=2747483 RepID=A0A8X6XI15_9ARAC|nr:hypothetical protein TNIN_412631 [Trichonephila inaurata madagascariensis]GFY52830.1 hypothetical protein TNIN_412641 [Trichonephila inaurata madagascariensis]